LRKKAYKSGHDQAAEFEKILSSGLCKYISGDIKEKSASFCDQPRISGKPYCAEHCKICLVPAPPFNEKKFSDL